MYFPFLTDHTPEVYYQTERLGTCQGTQFCTSFSEQEYFEKHGFVTALRIWAYSNEDDNQFIRG